MKVREQRPKSRVGWLFEQIGSQRLLYVLGILLAGLYSSVEAILSGSLYRAVLSLGEGQAYSEVLIQLAVIMLGIALVALVRGWAMTKYTDAASQTDKSLRSKVVHRFLDMAVPVRSMDRQTEWYNLIARDLNTAGKGIRALAPLFLSMLIAAISSILIASRYSVKMVLFVLGAGVFYWITTNLVKSKMTTARQDEQNALRVATGHVQETMQDLLNVRFYGMSDAVDRLLNKANQDYQQAGKRALYLSVFQSSLSNLGYSVAYVGSLALALFLVQRGEMILSDAMFIWPMCMQAAYAVNRMGNLMIEWQEPAVAVDRVREKLSLPTESESFEGSAKHDESLVGPLSITFEDVSFRYTSTDDSEAREVLSDFSLYVPAGQKLAVLGQSGSGKSTLVKLLLRFYEPTQGRILVNDIPIKEVSQETLRAAFAYMPQAPHLFAGSIRENFLIMNSTLNDEEMRTALNLVGLDSFAGDDGDVLDHAVGTSGNLLSGGERQRFGIARALVRGCRSYLMDEMTSALDGANDRKVTEMFMNLPDTTMLWITHRTDQLHLADRVIMMEKGRLIQDEVRDLVESE